MDWDGGNGHNVPRIRWLRAANGYRLASRDIMQDLGARLGSTPAILVQYPMFGYFNNIAANRPFEPV